MHKRHIYSTAIHDASFERSTHSPKLKESFDKENLRAKIPLLKQFQFVCNCRNIMLKLFTRHTRNKNFLKNHNLTPPKFYVLGCFDNFLQLYEYRNHFYICSKRKTCRYIVTLVTLAFPLRYFKPEIIKSCSTVH